MEPLTALALALGSAWGSGLNLYATVLVLGAMDAFGVVSLPDSMAVLSSTWVLAAAALMYFIEFFADKIPWVDSAWDAIHTAIRPVGGALIAGGAAFAACAANSSIVISPPSRRLVSCCTYESASGEVTAEGWGARGRLRLV